MKPLLKVWSTVNTMHSKHVLSQDRVQATLLICSCRYNGSEALCMCTLRFSIASPCKTQWCEHDRTAWRHVGVCKRSFCFSCTQGYASAGLFSAGRNHPVHVRAVSRPTMVQSATLASAACRKLRWARGQHLQRYPCGRGNSATSDA